MPLWRDTFGVLRCQAVLLSLLVAHSAVLCGQDSTTSSPTLKITVVGPFGALIPDAEITFKGKTTFTARTGESGSIQLQIPLGTYSVTIARWGFETKKLSEFAIQQAKPPDLEVVLELGPSYCDHCDLGGGVETVPRDLPNVIETVLVPDAMTAVKIAEPALIKKYGKRQIAYESPLTAVLTNGIWTVYGDLCCPDRKGQRTCEIGKCLGGVATLQLRQTDGKILSIFHTK